MAATTGLSLEETRTNIYPTQHHPVCAVCRVLHLFPLMRPTCSTSHPILTLTPTEVEAEVLDISLDAAPMPSALHNVCPLEVFPQVPSHRF